MVAFKIGCSAVYFAHILTFCHKMSLENKKDA